MSEKYILFINAVCLPLVIVMFLVLTLATRMKGAAGRAAFIVFIGTMPAHTYNLARTMEWFDTASFFYFIGFTNLLLLPLIYLFVHRQIDVNYKFKLRYLLHFIPFGINGIIGLFTFPWNETERNTWYIIQNNGIESWQFLINDLFLAVQILTYYPISIIYTRKKFKTLSKVIPADNLLQIRWVEQFLWVSLSLLLCVMIIYAINPRSDAWIIPILNAVLAMYLLYKSVSCSTQDMINKYHSAISALSKNETEKRYATSRLLEKEMNEYCKIIMDSLNSSKLYLNPDFSIKQLAEITNINQANISQSLNLYMKKNFFEIINNLRIEHAKQMMLSANRNNYTIEGIAVSCGFRSRSTFYAAFKKAENTTPSQWMASSSVIE